MRERLRRAAGGAAPPPSSSDDDEEESASSSGTSPEESSSSTSSSGGPSASSGPAPRRLEPDELENTGGDPSGGSSDGGSGGGSSAGGSGGDRRLDPNELQRRNDSGGSGGGSDSGSPGGDSDTSSGDGGSGAPQDQRLDPSQVGQRQSSSSDSGSAPPGGRPPTTGGPMVQSESGETADLSARNRGGGPQGRPMTRTEREQARAQDEETQRQTEDDFGLTGEQRDQAVGRWIANNPGLVDTGRDDPDGGVYSPDDIEIQRTADGRVVVGPSEEAIMRETTPRASQSRSLGTTGTAGLATGSVEPTTAMIADATPRASQSRSLGTTGTPGAANAGVNATNRSAEPGALTYADRGLVEAEFEARARDTNQGAASESEVDATVRMQDGQFVGRVQRSQATGQDVQDQAQRNDPLAPLRQNSRPVTGNVQGNDSAAVQDFAADPVGSVGDTNDRLVNETRSNRVRESVSGSSRTGPAATAATAATIVPRLVGQQLGFDSDDAAETAATAASVGVVAPEPTSTVGGLGALALLGGAAYLDQQFREGEIAVPTQRPGETQSEITAPTNPNEQPSEIDVGEATTSVSELDPESTVQDVEEVGVPTEQSTDLTTLRTAQRLGRTQGRRRAREEGTSSEFRRDNPGASDEELEEILRGPQEETTLGRDQGSLFEEVDPTTFERDPATGESAFVNQEASVSETQEAAEEVANTTNGQVEQTQEVSETGAGSGASPASTLPATATETASDVAASELASVDVDSALASAAGVSAATGLRARAGMGLGARLGNAAGTGELVASEQLLANNLQNVNAYANAPGQGEQTGGGSPERRDPPRGDRDSETSDESMFISEFAGTNTSNEERLAGYFAETVSVIATGSAQSPSDAVLAAEASDAQAAVGEYPTAAFLSDDPETAESIDQTLALFGGGGGEPTFAFGGEFDVDFGEGGGFF